jgi:hypothetical protein
MRPIHQGIRLGIDIDESRASLSFWFNWVVLCSLGQHTVFMDISWLLYIAYLLFRSSLHIWIISRLVNLIRRLCNLEAEIKAMLATPQPQPQNDIHDASTAGQSSSTNFSESFIILRLPTSDTIHLYTSPAVPIPTQQLLFQDCRNVPTDH